MFDLFKKYGIENFYFATVEEYENIALQEIGYGKKSWNSCVYSRSTIVFKMKNGNYLDLQYEEVYVDMINKRNPKSILTRLEPYSNYSEISEITKSKALKLGRPLYNEYAIKTKFGGFTEASGN